MSHRLYLDDLLQGQGPDSRENFDLTREQSHYLTRVLRLKKGAELYCFDGRGSEWRATVMSADSRCCVISLTEQLRNQPATTLPLILACAWLKGAAMDTVVQKATELGVSTIQVLHTQRSNVQLDDKRAANKLRHWRQIAISASEQSNRLFVPELPPVISFTELVGVEAPGCRLMLDLGAPILQAGEHRQALTLLVGPEGGWADEERNLALSQNVTRCSLGNLTLRAETAPLAALAAVQHSWGWHE